MTAILPKTARLSSRIIRILGCNPGHYTLQGTNTYLIGNSKSRLLLDCGEPNKPDYLNLLQSVLNEQSATIGSIIITHWHDDHVGGLADLTSKFNLKNICIYKFRNDEHDASAVDNQSCTFTYVKDKNEVKVDEQTTLILYETPGHTADHMVVYLKEENVLFSGDCILGEGSTVFSDLWSYMNSLKRIQSMKPSIIYPGHGPVIEQPEAKVQEYIQHRQAREKQILNVLPNAYEAAIDVDKLIQTIYPGLASELILGAKGNLVKHLDKLIRDRKVQSRSVNGDDVFWRK